MPYLDVLRDALLRKPSEEMVACQAPKPVLLPIGEMNTPWEWAPAIIDTQMFRLGQFAMIVVPAEFSTMAGRRLRNTVTAALQAEGMTDAAAEIVGLSNTYSDYVVTEEEYNVQRYEGASTIFGPNTLAAYQQQYTTLAQHLVAGDQPVQGPSIPNLLADMGSTLSAPEGDEDDIANPLVPTPADRYIGDCIMQPDGKYRQGGVAKATFVAGNPRNDAFRMRDDTFLTVERLVNDTWEVVYNDADWCTRFYWDRVRSSFRGGSVSEATIHWDIPVDEELGTYRFGHHGYRKDQVKGDVVCYEMQYSSEFQVVEVTYQDR